MLTLELTDSQYVEGIICVENGMAKNGFDHHHLEVIDQLNDIVANKKTFQVISLSSVLYKPILDTSKLIWYELRDTIKHAGAGYYYFNNVKIYTSHYVGFYAKKINNKSFAISIKPRFGVSIVNHLFSYALGLYLPKGESSQSEDKLQNLWFIALMWRANLEKAITKGQIPKSYKRINKNQRFFRGRLKLNNQIKYNITDESRFYCTYTKFSFDTTINRAIRYTYRILSKDSGLKNIVHGIAEHDQMLCDFGVSNDPITIQEIDSIRYNPMNIVYKPLMQVCKSLISYKSYKNDAKSNLTNDYAVFIDMAEVWENYIYKLLTKNLDSYDVISLNLMGGDYLFVDNKRPIRPDIIIKKDGKVLAVIDAKYKWYTKIGYNEQSSGAVSISDLYQMSTYLYRFGSEDTIGIFVTPCKDIGEGLVQLAGKKNRIGVLGLDLDLNDAKIDIQEREFIENIRKRLQR